MTDPESLSPSRLRTWLFAEEQTPEERLEQADEREQGHPWWKVMCLTGVDYFSTLGYQPGIAALAAGAIAPIATIVLVVLTLVGALPVYRRVAVESPHGQGSISMLEKLLPFWRGKLFVLALLGFAATDFIITITLSAADASAHIIENPAVASYLSGQQITITVGLVLLLAAVFLKGFSEAMGVAVALVTTYLALNLVVIGVAFAHVAAHPGVIGDWGRAMTEAHGDPVMIVAMALVVFPKLALGLSGFETGVAVMTHVRGSAADTEEAPNGRIRNTKKLLTLAALLMSGYLIASSLVTTWLIPAEAFEDGGDASGRALAYLAHEYLGGVFGTVYDVSTIAILWFAGASAMAGLLNLIPRYLPRYGMAPSWSRAVRPLVLALTTIALAITWVFKADVNAQGGAYATGVLVLITSAAVAVTLAARRARQRVWTVAFALISAVFTYTTIVNVVERPDGVKIASFFIGAILVVSFLSRLQRAFELRALDVTWDPTSAMFLRDCARRSIRLIANEPGERDSMQYQRKIAQIIDDNDLPDAQDIVFVEVRMTDPSEFETVLEARGEVLHGTYRVITVESPAVPNALAALLLAARDLTGSRPHLYLQWSEGNPLINVLKFLLFGAGEVAPVTREVLRQAEPRARRRPHLHVG